MAEVSSGVCLYLNTPGGVPLGYAMYLPIAFLLQIVISIVLNQYAKQILASGRVIRGEAGVKSFNAGV